jgi:dimethylhistidine N-methyltransferase
VTHETTTAVAADPAFRADVLAGLAQPNKAVPARWLYDRRGSELFEEITKLPEYYPTRIDTALLEAHCGEVAAIAGMGNVIVELGAGSAVKTPILLRCVAPSAYVPVDISGEFLRQSAEALRVEFSDLAIYPVEADFMVDLPLPRELAGEPKLGFFPGSTIGNMIPRTAVDLLRAVKAALGIGAYLLIGMDRAKSADVLIPAYDDAAGVTEQFNLNLLHRINAELGGDIPIGAFRHRAVWNEPMSRIEMHLEATRDAAFTVAGRGFSMRKGETIHTENSHKYGPRDARLLLRAAGWSPVAEWTDAGDNFALILAEAEAPRFAP